MTKTTKVIASLFVGAILIQFIPYGKEHQNPPVMSEPAWDSLQTKELFKNACANCHSHETIYPWYSHFAPISWLIQNDVEEGREHFNVSLLGIQKKNKIKDAADEVEKGDMPPFFYIPLHPEAKLTKEQQKALAAGLEKTFGKENE